MSFKIFELSHVCDEGYDGADMLFFAYEEVQVAESILKEIKKYAKTGDKTLKRKQIYLHFVNHGF
jgi:hypothetical protein